MLEIKPLSDIDTINRIMLNEFVQNDISDDASFGFSFEFLPDGYDFYGVYNNDICVGFYMIHLHNSITAEIHTTLLPECRGVDALKAGRLIIAELFKKHEKIISWVASYNKKALVYAQILGFSIEGENRLSFQKGGIIYNQYLVGLTKGEFKCQ